MLDVLCVGSATADTIALVPHLPAEDERLVADSFVNAGGGPAATAAVALARLGARVGLCCVVGDDDTGAQLREALAAEGVALDWVSVVPGATTHSCVLVSQQTGSRTIVTQAAREPRFEDVPMDVSTWLHADQTGIGPAIRAMAGCPDPPLLSVDGGNAVDLADLTAVRLYAPSVQALRRRYRRAATLSDALDLAMADGATWVVATDGSRGAYVRSRDVDEHVPAPRLAIVSTLGAGDVFHGALLAALVAGAAVLEATQEACMVAALSCRAIDGRSGIPRRDELSAVLDRERMGSSLRSTS